MNATPIAVDEARRLEILRGYDLFDTPADPDLDELTALAARICETPIALISLVDETRLWFRSKAGLSIGETPRARSCCGQAILQPGIFIVSDAAQDDRFAGHPLVMGEPHIRFYAGVPLITDQGQALGTLCVIDNRIRQLSPGQQEALQSLARTAMALLALRRPHREPDASGSAGREQAQILSNRLAAIVESSEDAIIGKDLDGHITGWNRGAQNIFGYTAAEIMGESILRLIPADRHGEEQDILEKIGRGGKVEHFETVRKTKEGRLIEVSVTISPIRDAGNRVIGVSKVLRDITRHKLAEQAQRESNRVLVQTTQRLRQALVTARMVWWEWNIKTGSIHIDPCGAQCILGYSVDQLAGMTFDAWLNWMPEEDRAEVRRTLALTLAGENDEWICEYRWREPAGGYIWLRDIGRISLRSPEGKPLLLTGSTQEINHLRLESSRIKQLEYDLMQSQKMETLGQFSGGIAHDFNNLVTGIGGGIQCALQALPAGHPVAAYLENARHGCTKAQDLVKRLMQFARERTVAQPKELHLDRLVRDIAPLIRASMAENVSLNFDLDACPRLLADEAQMLQMILNLTINGAHAIGSLPGSITIRLKRDPEEPRLPAKGVVLSVTDTGCGMDEKTQAKIFEPYFTTKPLGVGTGLGLAVVLGAVKDLGGEIACQSALGQGTTFQIRLPLARHAKPRPEQPPVEPPAVRITGRRVLVVDDDPIVATMLSETLRLDGQKVEAFTSAPDALEKLRELPARFDLLITDLAMPQMSGLDLIRAARKLHRDLPVLLISGDFGQLRPEEDLAGFAQMMVADKPLDLADFRQSVQVLLAGTA